MQDSTMDGSSTSKANQIKTTKVVYPQVYSYTLPDEPDNEGSQKIGYTERKDVDSRILEQVNTAAKRHRYNKLWSGPAFFNDQPPKDFKDKFFHRRSLRAIWLCTLGVDASNVIRICLTICH